MTVNVIQCPNCDVTYITDIPAKAQVNCLHPGCGATYIQAYHQVDKMVQWMRKALWRTRG